ncbi:MAG: diguanylate cyclase [Steroidobacteraceae bacterium]
MPVSESQPDSHSPLESPSAEQLRKGFNWLRFNEPLEKDFRESYRAQSRVAVQLNLWLCLSLVVTFALIARFILPEGPDRLVTTFSAGIFVPIVLLSLIGAYSPLYWRWHSLMVQVFAPAFGVNLVFLALMARGLETSFLPGLVLAIISIYFLAGLTFFPAARSGLIVLAAYVFGSAFSEIELDRALYGTLVLLSANIIGATVCYRLEKVNRTNFLEARLLKEMASRDGLTGIYNRRILDEHVDTVWQQAMRERAPIALLLVDIDYFKAYNDYFGHQAGDEALRHVAQTLARSARRPLDFAARYGGEEFAVVLYYATREYVEEVATRIQQNMETLALKHPASPIAKQLTVSIGAACIVPAPERSPFGFVQLADEALYEAKGQGRNRCIIMDKEYEQMSTGSFRKTYHREARPELARRA